MSSSDTVCEINARRKTVERVQAKAIAGLQLRVSELATATGRPEAQFYRAIHRNELRAIWLGRTPMIPAPEALRLLGVSPPPTADTAA